MRSAPPSSRTPGRVSRGCVGGRGQRGRGQVTATMEFAELPIHHKCELGRRQLPGAGRLVRFWGFGLGFRLGGESGPTRGLL